MACTAAYMPWPFSSFTGNCERKYGLPTELLDGVARLVAGLHKHAIRTRHIETLPFGLSRVAHATISGSASAAESATDENEIANVNADL